MSRSTARRACSARWVRLAHRVDVLCVIVNSHNISLLVNQNNNARDALDVVWRNVKYCGGMCIDVAYCVKGYYSHEISRLSLDGTRVSVAVVHFVAP